MTSLSLMQLVPDREAALRWAANGNLLRKSAQYRDVDDGYLWHAILKAAFADDAPKPFVDRAPLRANTILGYVQAPSSRLTGLHVTDPLLADAVGSARVRTNTLPERWQRGRRLSFEVRARPVVRCRDKVSDNVDEVDVAAHRYARDASVSREQAYTQWLEKELARDQSAALQSARLVAVKRTRVLRRTQGQDRRWVAIEGPDIWFTGELVIDNPEAFSALLRRGIGRHRAFGFGCLLVAPSGVLG